MILFIESSCSKGHTTCLEPTLTMITSMFTTHLCIMSKNGCSEELDVKKLEGHEKYCPFQDVQCPVISCTKSIVFNDAQNHMDKTHNCLKVDEEWEFKGTQEELIQNVCCLSSYGQLFIVQFQMYEKKCGGIWKCGHQDKCNNQVDPTHNRSKGYTRYDMYYGYCAKILTPESGTCKNSVKENLIFLRIAMLGHQDEVHSFQATMTYFHENGKKFVTEVDVLPITSGKEEIDSFSAIPMKKLTTYYDVKAGEFKTQPIQFTLKITNEKLDEIVKDKNGLEDSDPDE